MCFSFVSEEQQYNLQRSFRFQAVEQQINKENIPVDVNVNQKVSSPRVLSPRSSVDTVILPEKIKIPTERESRRSLEFTEKESESESISSSQSSKGVVDIPSSISSKHSSSISRKPTGKDTSVVSSVKSHADKKEVNKSEKSSIKVGDGVGVASSKQFNREDSVDEVSDISIGKDQSEISNTNTQNKPATDLSIAEELTSRTAQESSKNKSIDRIYDDDFFESSVSSKSSTSTLKHHASSSKGSLPLQSAATKLPSEPSSHLPPEVSNKDNELSATHNVRSSVEYSNQFDNESTSLDKTQSSSIAELLAHTEKSDKSDTSEEATKSRVKTPPQEDAIKSMSDSSSKTSLRSISSSKTTPQDDFTKSNVNSALGFRLNDRVEVEGSLMGTIRYLGKTSFSPVLVAGIELDEPMGTNNGTFHDRQYFQCAQDHGFFTTIERLQLFNNEKSNRTENVLKQKSSSTTIEEVDESLDAVSLKEDLPLSENLEVEDPANVQSSSSTNDVINLNKHNEQLQLSDSELPFQNSKSAESSFADSISVEIPSPAKLDSHKLAENISDSILESIVVDSFQALISASTPKVSREVEENQDLKELSISSDNDHVSSTREQPSGNVDGVTKSLLNKAISLMIDVGREKERKLSTDDKKKSFLSLIVTEDDDDDDDEDVYSDNENENENKENEDLLSQKINQLKNVHDQLDMLLGDDDDDDVIESISAEQSSAREREEEQPLFIPLNDKDTKAIVSLALQEINEQNLSIDQLERLIVPDCILALQTAGELDEPSTMLYKTLIFDLTLQLYCELKEFKELQSKPREPWLKRTRKTFSKFTRKALLDEKNEFQEMVTEHVCGCVGLQTGRPSLTELKRKLPLNLEKKDYVDAILVDELRQEEGQWVNYDEDELRVKFQLADNILESLLEETVDIINKVL